MRPLAPYIDALHRFVTGQATLAEFRSRIIQQYVYTDGGVDWEAAWCGEIARALERVHASVEIVYPEAPDESYISEGELLRTSRECLGKLLDATR